MSEDRTNFEYFSNEYAQALQAYSAIENQAATLLLMGASEDLRQFIDQFVAMAGASRDLALEKGEQNFADWFAELVAKAERLRTGVKR